MIPVNKVDVFSQFAHCLLLIIGLSVVPLLNVAAPAAMADGLDPSMVPPDVTIPYAVPPGTPTGTGAPASVVPGQTAAAGDSGTNNQLANPLANGNSLQRRLPMNNSGIPGLAGLNSTPPGVPAANPAANPYSRFGAAPSTFGNSATDINAQIQQNLNQIQNQRLIQAGLLPHNPAATGMNGAVPPATGANGAAVGTSVAVQAPAAPQQAAVGATAAGRQDPLAVIQTTKGTITIRLFRDLAPQTVANFIDLVQKGFYNGLTWHRVVPGFVAQTGCPKGDGTGSYIDPVTNQPRFIPLEINQRLRHNAPGVVAMARFGNNPNSASSQFYITLSAQPHLDTKYAIFGGVISGMDAVYRITTADRVLSVSIQGQ